MHRVHRERYLDEALVDVVIAEWDGAALAKDAFDSPAPRRLRVIEVLDTELTFQEATRVVDVLNMRVPGQRPDRWACVVRFSDGRWAEAGMLIEVNAPPIFSVAYDEDDDRYMNGRIKRMEAINEKMSGWIDSMLVPLPDADADEGHAVATTKRTAKAKRPRRAV